MKNLTLHSNYRRLPDLLLVGQIERFVLERLPEITEAEIEFSRIIEAVYNLGVSEGREQLQAQLFWYELNELEPD